MINLAFLSYLDRKFWNWLARKELPLDSKALVPFSEFLLIGLFKFFKNSRGREEAHPTISIVTPNYHNPLLFSSSLFSSSSAGGTPTPSPLSVAVSGLTAGLHQQVQQQQIHHHQHQHQHHPASPNFASSAANLMRFR